MSPSCVTPYGSARFALLPGLVTAPGALARLLAPLVQGADLAHLGVEPKADEPYGRSILHRDQTGEVMLASWSGRLPCAPHDHGQARGAVLIVAGAFQEVCYELCGGELVARRTRELTRGAILTVMPGVLHAMFPRDRGLTLHIYAPAIAGMRVFDATRAELIEVDDDHGAWVPRASEANAAGKLTPAILRTQAATRVDDSVRRT